ncbi:MAG: PAS domain S-box protein [Candidatus Nitrotoga sp.]
MTKNLTTQTRLTFFICLMGIILLGAGSAAMFGMSRAKDSLTTVYDDRLLVLNQLKDIESLILQNRLAIVTCLTAPPPPPDFISINTAMIEKNTAEISKIWEAFMGSDLMTEEKLMAAKFVEDRLKFINEGLNPAVAALRANDIKKANQIVVENIRSLDQPVVEDIMALGKLQMTVAKQEYEEIRSSYETTRNISIFTGIVGLGLVLWIGFLLVRTISRLLEEAVKRETQFRTILDAALDAVISMDINGLVIDWNPQAEKIFGYSRADTAGKLLSNLIIPPSFRDAHNRGLEHYLKTGEGPVLSKRIEVTGMRSDGSEFPIELAIVPIRSGELLFFNAFIRDITSRKQAELGRVLDESSNEIYVFDAQTLHLTMINAGAQRNLGYSMEDLKGMTALIFEPNLTHEIFEQRIGPLRLGEKDVVTFEVEHQRKDKSLYPVEICMHLSAKECPPVFVAIIHDITERKKIECMKSEFISTVSHELRTPLTSIRGSLGLVAGGVSGELPPQAKMLVDIAHKNSERLILLVNDILDMEKIEAGKMEIQCNPVELMPLLHQALDANCDYGGQFNVRYELENDLPGILVSVDANRLMQVLANLLSNAAKFTFAGDIVKVSVIVSGKRVRVAVKDHGSGISEQFRSQVFQKFAQGDSSDTRHKGGTGLGLSITRAIIENMGGHIGFNSVPNVLTTFFIEFPVEDKIANSAFSMIEDRKQILICDDDPLVAELLRFMLEQDGYTVDVAYNTAQAKCMLDQIDYAAMTLDLSLPDQDGISFIRKLRMEEKTANIPIVIVSARAIEGSLELNGEAFKVIDWISKPLDKDQIVLAVRRAVGRFTGVRPRVLHVEDDSDIFKVMHGLIGDIVDLDHAGMLTEASELLEKCRYDLVILDLTLPDGSGQQLLPILNSATPPIPVMVFSAREIVRDEINNVASVMVKSRTSDAQLLATIKRLIGVG